MPIFRLSPINQYAPLDSSEESASSTKYNLPANDGDESSAALFAEDNNNLSVSSVSTTLARDLDTIETTKLGIYSIVVVSASAVGGVLFGFDTAIISSCLLFIKEDLGHSLSSFEKEIVTSITSMTALLGSIIAGYLSDKLGRRNVLAICCGVFIASAIVMGLARSVIELALGRAIVGLAVGGASMVVPVFISEVSPASIRGMLLTLNSISTTGGQVIAYVLANFLKESKNNWRISFLVSGVPPFLFLMVARFMPESPRFSIIKGRIDDAEVALSKIFPYATPSQVQDKVMLIQADVNNSKRLYNKPFWEVIRGKKSTQNALIIGSILMAIQQAVGFNNLMYYSAIIFEDLGFEDPIFASISIALTNFIFTFVPFFLLDRIGRRKTLLRTTWVLGVAMLVVSILYLYKSHINTDSSILNIFILITMIVYVAGYASGLGTVPWLSVELLPLEARAIGGTVITCCNWSTNFFISLSFLSLMDTLSPGLTFGFFGVICVLSWVWIFKMYPDVTGIPLEQVSKIFENGVDMYLADELRRKNKASYLLT